MLKSWPMGQFDYLAIGHITHDQTPAGLTVGGTVAYAGRAAQALGCRTAVVTSADERFDLQAALPGVAIHRVPAPQTTTFANHYNGAGRQQWLYGLAAPLAAGEIPRPWRRSAIVHLAPVAGEVDPAIIRLFTNSLVGLTPQGWLRRWDETGRVSPARWEAAEMVLPLAAAVIMSEEDLPEPTFLNLCRQHARLLVLTQGPAGCTVFLGDEMRSFPAPVVLAQDPTGAGDIFAAAFLIRLLLTRGNAWEAAIFANDIAAESLTQIGLDAKIAHLAATLQP
jgi:hypothetical protein